MKILIAKKGTWSTNFKFKNLKEENGDLYLEKNDKKNLIALFPTRSGFTTNIVIPTVLSHKGNMIIFDFKNEVYNATAKEMKNFGFKVYNMELDNVNSNNDELYKSDIENLLKENKFVLYIGIKEIRKIEILAKNRIVDFILGKVQELNIGCLTIFDECSPFTVDFDYSKERELNFLKGLTYYKRIEEAKNKNVIVCGYGEVEKLQDEIKGFKDYIVLIDLDREENKIIESEGY